MITWYINEWNKVDWSNPWSVPLFIITLISATATYKVLDSIINYAFG
jgi:hypothetical protein